MAESRSIGARLVHGKVVVLVLTCTVMKVLDGSQHYGQKLSTQPSGIFKLCGANAIKRTNKDWKHKAEPAAKLKRKKARYSTAIVDKSSNCQNGIFKISIKSQLLLSLLYDCRHDGGSDVLDVAFNMPADQLKEYMIVYYKTEVMVDSNKAKSI